MVKTLALLAAGLLAWSPYSPHMPGPTISLRPVPPVQGKKLDIHYTGSPGTVLVLEWDPAGQPTSATIDATGSATVVVPGSATSLIVSDPAGGAQPAATMVSP